MAASEGSETTSASLVSSGGGDTPTSQRIPTPRDTQAAEDGASMTGSGFGPVNDAQSPAAASITSGTGSFQSVPTVFSLQRSLNQRTVELKMQWGDDPPFTWSGMAYHDTKEAKDHVRILLTKVQANPDPDLWDRMSILFAFEDHEQVLQYDTTFVCCHNCPCGERHLALHRIVAFKDTEELVELHEEVAELIRVRIPAWCKAGQVHHDFGVQLEAFDVRAVTPFGFFCLY